MRFVPAVPILLAASLARAGGPSAEVGRDLFSGARPLRNGGPPCGACHAMGGEGLAFTASLGPVLSAGLGGMDPEMLDGLLETLPFPTMTPLYDGRPLAPDERADLGAYLAGAALQGPPVGVWRFEALGAALAAGVFLGIAFASRRRKPSSRARLLARAHSNGGSR